MDGTLVTRPKFQFVNLALKYLGGKPGEPNYTHYTVPGDRFFGP
jgi:hypothetical protein